MTATRVSVSADHGSSGPPSAVSLRTNTEPATSASRANATPSSTATGADTAGANPSNAPTRAARRRTRSTLRSTTDSAMSPLRTAATSASPHEPSGPGITRSWENLALFRLRTAVQSLITTPSKPHSEFNGVSNNSFSVTVAPLTELYELITSHARPSATARSNGDRYSSRSVAVVHPDVDREPVGLEVVGHVMLRRRADTVLLHSGDVGGARAPPSAAGPR